LFLRNKQCRIVITVEVRLVEFLTVQCRKRDGEVEVGACSLERCSSLLPYYTQLNETHVPSKSTELGRDAFAQSYDGRKSHDYAIIILDHDFLVFIGAGLPCLTFDVASQLEAGFRSHESGISSRSGPPSCKLNEWGAGTLDRMNGCL
jgi:hypothetical protein